MARAQRIAHHILSRARSYDFRGISEAADDSHAGELGARRAGEGAAGESSALGGGESGAEGGEEGHFVSR